MKRVRHTQQRPREVGFIVTWDVDSRDRSSVNCLYRFLFGDETSRNGKVYRYSGFLEKDGVRYLGQSVVFVRPALLADLEGFLFRLGIDHEATRAVIG